MRSSKDGLMATLDLTSASDRVPATLVSYMLSSNPDFRDAAFACRTRTAKLPSGEILSLLKFASMGSALCFPIESMYFYTLCVGALLRIRNLPLTCRNTFLVSRDVYVYGDDIIVPTHEAESVALYLQKYFCKVNMSKSFWSGNFRESCGTDAFLGKLVTPVYLREMPPVNRQNVDRIVSWIKTAGLFVKKGYSLTSDCMYNTCERLLGSLPTVSETSALLGRLAYHETYSIGRWNKALQTPEVKGWSVSPVYRKDNLEGYAALVKCLLQLEERGTDEPDYLIFRKSEFVRTNFDEAEKDALHLTRSARYGVVTLKRRWLRPY